MTLEEEARLSFYQPLTCLNEAHGVYLVKNSHDGRIYVRKTLTVFNAEIFRQLKAVPIPHTPRIYEAVEADDRLIVVEEYVNGTTLQQRIDARGLLTEYEVRDIVGQLCVILRALHSLQPPIIHRDIKPSNILLTPDGTVYLIDMNAAKWGGSRAGRDTELIGTAGFAAPEQYGFASASVQTDIYAVGVLMNLLLTGVLPQERYPGGAWEPLIRRCTKIDPLDRYASVAQLRQALAALPVQGPAQNSSPAPRRYLRYALPGFRTLDLRRMLPASMGYLLLIYLGLSMTGDSPAATLINQVCFTATLLAIAFALGNYLGFQDKLGITQAGNVFLRLILRLLMVTGIFFSGVFLCVILESLLL